MSKLKSPVVNHNANELEEIRLDRFVRICKLAHPVGAHVDLFGEFETIVDLGATVVCLVSESFQAKDEIVWDAFETGAGSCQ